MTDPRNIAHDKKVQQEKTYVEMRVDFIIRKSQR